MAVDEGAALAVSGLRFAWPGAPALLEIEHFSVARGESVFLHGPSGSGKSTLLNLVAGTLVPAAGSIVLAGHELGALRGAALDRVRADHVGFVFQMFNLLPFLSVLDNVLLPCRFSPRRRARALARDGSLTASARRLLARLGLDEPALLARAAGGLSVGQQQRVAAARALIGAPDLVICDEPTSALDLDARAGFVALLFDECREHGAALLFVSHDHSLRGLFGRALSLAEINRATRTESAA